MLLHKDRFLLMLLASTFFLIFLLSYHVFWKNIGQLFSFCRASVQFSSVQFSRSVVSDSLGPHESQHARPPCPSPTSGVHSDSRPSSQWCHLAISSSVVPFSSCPQSLPASESFPMGQLFAWGGQSRAYNNDFPRHSNSPNVGCTHALQTPLARKHESENEWACVTPCLGLYASTHIQHLAKLIP